MAGAVIDPGGDLDQILAAAREENVRIEKILLTHAHIDHAGAVGKILERFPVPFLCHEQEQEWLDGMQAQARMFGVRAEPTPKPTRYVKDGEQLAFGTLKFKVLHTPGHTAGGVCYLIDRVLFAGDTLFEGSIGRTDLPGGSYDQIIDSILNRIVPLGDDVVVYSGHGPETNVAREKRHNPFLR